MTQRSINQRQTLQAIQKQHEELLSQKAKTGEVGIEQYNYSSKLLPKQERASKIHKSVHCCAI